DLRAIPAQKLLDAFAPPRSNGFDFGPDVDGYFLPEPVPAIFAAGKQNDVSLLAGWTHDEGSFELTEKPTAEKMRADAQKALRGNRVCVWATRFQDRVRVESRRSRTQHRDAEILGQLCA